MILEETARAQGAKHPSTCEWRHQGNGSLAEHFEYDANGNRTLGFNAAAGTTYTGTYDDQDRLLSYGPFDFTYTANGELETKTNRQTSEAWLFQYDALGNLLTVGLPNGDLIDYLVDGMGRRVGKKKNGVLLKQWIYRDDLKPVAELDGAGNLVSEFVYGAKGNVPDYVRRGGATYRVISDQLGSPRYAVNVANSTDVPFAASYTSFGVATGTGLDWMPFGFAGGQFDGDTGLLRFGARDADPASGRWLAKDPLQLAGDVNLYRYPDDPIQYADVTGLDAEPTSSCNPHENCIAELGDCTNSCQTLPKAEQRDACSGCCTGAYQVCQSTGFFVTPEPDCATQAKRNHP